MRPPVKPKPKKQLDTKTIYQIVGGAVGFLVLMIVLTAIFSGSGKATLTGRVTYQGRPVIWGSVLLVSSDGKSASGPIDSDGSFRVEDAPPGPVSVAVVSHDPLVQHWATGLKTTRVRPTASIFSAAPVDRQRWFPLPPQYEEPASSGVTLLLSKGANQLDITLP